MTGSSTTGRSRPTRRRTRRGTAAALPAAILLVAASCSQGDPGWQELTGWQRDQFWNHADVVAFDRVATAVGPATLSWVTRTAGDDSLAYMQVVDGGPAQEIRLSMPEDPVIIPVGVATDGERWVAVAVTRERANGENTGLVAWQGGGDGGATAPPRATRLRPADGADPARGGATAPQAVNAGQVAGVSVVVGLADGAVVAWTSGDGQTWEPSSLDLGSDAELVSIDLIELGDRLVLGAVDGGGGGHLWVSDDGREWAPVDAGGLPSDVSSVTALGPVGDGKIALAWVRADDREGGDPRTGVSATVQRFDGESLDDEGTIERGDDGVAAFGLDGATVSPEGRLVVVGRALDSDDGVWPMLWVRERDSWEPTAQPELSARLGAELREVTTTGDDHMLAVITPATHIDVELWGWRSDD